MNQNLDSQTIMHLNPGHGLDKPVEEALRKYVAIDYGCSYAEQVTPWSTNKNDAMELWDHIEEHFDQVGIMRCGDAPNIISQFASIGSEEDGLVTVYTGNWMESLCKAFLLYENGHRGDFMHPEWERKMKQAPKRVVQ